MNYFTVYHIILIAPFKHAVLLFWIDIDVDIQENEYNMEEMHRMVIYTIYKVRIVRIDTFSFGAISISAVA